MNISSSLLFNKIKKSLSQNKPFVSYRAPNQNELRAFYQKDKRVYKSKKLHESGFIFAPFDLSQNDIVVIPANKSEFNTARYTSKDLISNDFEDEYKTINSLEKNTYKKLVNHCIQFLKESDTLKIVLSRRITIDTDFEDYVGVFKNLLDSRKNAMVYLWFHPKVGLWIGATPETLVQLDGRDFETMSLAGTKALSDEKIIEWTLKEKKEQKYVTDFILEQISTEVNFVKTSETHSVIAGNVAHLCTEIKGTLESKTTLFKLITKLHPTPAVCGLPQKSARDFILEHEGYNRKYYTGFLGELNFNGISELYVNLRCIEVAKESSYIYVGGGITEESIAEDEWQETVEKSKVIKKALAVR